MATRERLRNEEEWNEFWADFFGEDIAFESYCKDDERMKHRKNRRVNRRHKSILVKKNTIRQNMRKDHVERARRRLGIDVKEKRISLFRSVENGKNRNPSKPISKRENQRVFSSDDAY